MKRLSKGEEDMRNNHGYTKMQRVKSAAFMACCVTAVMMAAAVIIFVGYVLLLRTQFRKTALEINDKILAAPTGKVMLSQGENVFPVDKKTADYYNKFLMNRYTTVFSRKRSEPDDKTIKLILDESSLSFIGLEDGSAIALIWKTEEKTEYYKVRSQTTFQQLEAYFQNCRRKSEKHAAD